MKRKFVITYNVDCVIEVDDEVIDRVDDEWRNSLYDLKNTEEIIDMIAYNMIFNGATLSQLDGWADMPDNKARIVDSDIFIFDFKELRND